MTFIEPFDRRANILTLIAGGACLALIALAVSLILQKVNATRELTFAPVLLPFAFTVPAILFKILFDRIGLLHKARVATIHPIPACSDLLDFPIQAIPSSH